MASHTATHHVLGEPAGRPLAVGQPAPEGTGALDAVACANLKHCWAVGQAGPANATTPQTEVVATQDGGIRWKAQRVPGGVSPQLAGIACPDTEDCIAVGSTGAPLPGSSVVLTTRDGGALWSPGAAPADALNVAAVWCASVADCSILVSEGSQLSLAHTADFGQTWQPRGSLPPSFLGAKDLSCDTSGVCLVAGFVPTTDGHGHGALARSADNGQTWTLATVPAGVGVLRDATCVGSSTCLAVGTTATTISEDVPAQGELLRSADGGQTWAVAGAAPSSVDDVYGVACPSSRICAVVGTRWAGQPQVEIGAVAQSRDGGTQFTAASGAYIPLPLMALSCPTASACVVVGGKTVGRLSLLAPARRSPQPR